MTLLQSGLKIACALLLTGATACFALAPARGDPAVRGGICGCKNSNAEDCADVLNTENPCWHCCPNQFHICLSHEEGGNPFQWCSESWHHCHGGGQGVNEWCATLQQGNCVP